MKSNTFARWARLGLVLGIGVFLGAGAQAQGVGERSKGKKPELIVRASPMVGFAPAKVQFLAILQGGDDDYEEYYCTGIEWDWDDDTVSQSTPDCDPYEPGESRITRRYSATHVFRLDGRYEVKFKLKRKNDVLALASVTIQVQPG
ncbi:MAG TPA: hypothetical protein PKK95_11780 [Vicinamibacterales bacterium]|nr:hypothetical protein [Acidobacteriota bacterium]HOC18944.1 hypothetical protein [Vicinamibacterales bacterium]